MAAGRDSIANTVRVSFLVCLVCAVVVSTASVSLQEAQRENRLQYRQVHILQAASMYQPGMALSEAFERIERRFVEVDTGDYVDMPEDYDPQRAARDPERSRSLDPDPAGIRRQAYVQEVFLAWGEDDRLARVILPVHGYGLWSTMYGFLALEPDANTVAGIGFFEHGETPGLGGEIENPRWQGIWEGKELFDEEGEVAIRVIKGAVPDDTDAEEHLVDGLTGATITTEGVNKLVRFWAGSEGYGPYLERLREGYQRDGPPHP
ncbi:Na+-transporting NADH:ubiquinone oxidoreductase subunit C [Alkalispirillum mobile]|uniref:Na(+)-translocating NADH-quinone reductase subunit C n=1 Tax=Alkalispirillum mobile TaxID=85925 RepID=A0A498C6C5_9GAMM|nr:Na(+)-translocating NADH-quinone reductase subunit C [Alkalispirillum mobile]RLK51425.1 Na+-transporting NADH:ubiquinone oxidoreductase subunit C [Alkalispirillum mobile]